MEPLPYGYKMGDEVCRTLVKWKGNTVDDHLLMEGLIYNTWVSNGEPHPRYWRLTGKGGRLLRAITANMMTYYLNNNW